MLDHARIDEAKRILTRVSLGAALIQADLDKLSAITHEEVVELENLLKKLRKLKPALSMSERA